MTNTTFYSVTVQSSHTVTVKLLLTVLSVIVIDIFQQKLSVYYFTNAISSWRSTDSDNKLYTTW